MIKETSSDTWFALYTRARAEKKVYDELLRMGIDAYLPIQRNLKQWSDRKKWVEEPLFHSYVFIKSSIKDYYAPLQILGSVNYVSFEGKPAKIPDSQIETLKLIIASVPDVEVVHENFQPGQLVTIETGTLHGLCGELVEYRSKKAVLVRIDHIGKSLIINISPSYLKVLEV